MASEVHSFLVSIAVELRRENAAISRMDSALVERDIAVRRREAVLGRRWASVRSRIRKELERLGVSEAGWCREELGCDITTMRRRVQLAKGWVQYERARRHAGNNGQFALIFGLSLIPKPVGSATKGHRLSFRSAKGAGQLDLSRCQFVAGDALTELRDRDTRTDFRVYNNPLGRNSGSVWRINSSNYRGTHTATFPPDLVRRMIECSCDDDSLVMDVFGGAGTTALVALQLGHRAITIDINPAYTDEARVRIANAPGRFCEPQDDTDQATSVAADYASSMAVAAE